MSYGRIDALNFGFKSEKSFYQFDHFTLYLRFFPVDLDFGEDNEEVKKLGADAG